jgi:hypothetical protein
MRDFLLAPYFYEQGESLSDALDRGSRVLGSNRWRRAFRRVEEWYGPFDAPLTETGEDAWKVWLDVCVERRHGLVHGNAVEEATGEEAAEVLGYADRIATWYAQLLFVSGKHPMARELWQLLADAAKAFREISDSAARDLGSRDEEQP